MANNTKTFGTGITLEPQSADPASPSEGQLQYADGTTRTEGLWVYKNGAWVQPDAGNASTVTTNANLTGKITSVGNATSLGSFTSLELKTALSDETGSGAAVFGTSPTIDGVTLTSPTRLDMKKDTLANLQTYAASAADGQLVFATDTQSTYVVKSSALAAVGGSSGINYILASDAESGIGAWSTYADAAASSPVDGTGNLGGGTPFSTFAVSTDTSLRGASNFLFTHSANNRQGEGFSYAFTIDNSDKGKVLQGSFEYKVDSGTFADNDLSFWIYDVTNATLIQPAPYLLKNSGIIEKFAFEFQTASNSTSYRLIGHVATSTATAYTLRFDNFNISPQAKLYGSPITDWITFTPTGSWSTNTVYTGRWRRNGNMMDIEYKLALGGAPNAVDLYVIIPNGLSIESSSILSETLAIADATGLAVDVATQYYEVQGQYNSATSIAIFRKQSAGADVTNSNPVNATAPFTWGSGDKLTFKLKVPIQGWAASQVMSNDSDVRVVAAIISGNPASATVGNPLIVPTIGYDSHAAYNSTTGRYTVQVPGLYKMFGALQSASSATTLSIYKNASSSQLCGNLDSNGEATYCGMVSCIAGDIIDIRPGGTVDATDMSLNIERVSGPTQIGASETISFSVNTSTTAATTSAPFLHTVKDHDTHAAYSASTGKFTAPSSGKYCFQATSFSTTAHALKLHKNGTAVVAGITSATSTESLVTFTLSLVAGDTIECRPSTNTTASGDATTNVFSGFRIGI